MTRAMGASPPTPQLEFVRECVLLARRWRARVDERLKAVGLTLSRATVLYWIDALPGAVSQRELADVVGIEGPTLVRLLHALEAQQLIERVSLPGDRRVKTIRLTAAARPLLDQLMDVTDGLIADRLDMLDHDRMATAASLAREAREALN